jgi:hypothetical protein
MRSVPTACGIGAPRGGTAGNTGQAEFEQRHADADGHEPGVFGAGSEFQQQLIAAGAAVRAQLGSGNVDVRQRFVR